MTVYISAKQLSRRKANVAQCRCELSTQPENLRALIRTLVLDSVSSYHRRIQDPAVVQPLSAETLEDMGQVGKIGFGIPYGSREADPEAAVDTAIRGFEDGLFRFFVADKEIESLDDPLPLQEGDTITIIRLVMLTGGMLW